MADDTNERTPLIEYESPTDEELTGCGATLACDPRRSLHRYLVLIIMCFLSFGSYFCYDNPAALQDKMLRDLSLSEQQFMSFYAWYSWPNVILCFFGGFLLDRLFGVRLGTIIFCAFVLLGQLVFALGGVLDTYWLMCFGRFLFGVGGESLCVAQNTYAVKWFKGKELHMVFGLQLTFSRVGSTVNMNVMNPIYEMVNSKFGVYGHHALGISLFFGVVFCVTSLLCAFAMAYFDKRNDRVLHKGQLDTGDVIKITDVKNFPFSLWMLCIVCVAYYVTVLPFIALGKVFFEMKYDMSPTMSNTVNSMIYIVSAVVSPICGFLIDKLGRNVWWVIMGVVLTMVCHALLAFTFVTPWVSMLLMGVAFSLLASALWPMAAYMVAENMLGTAYGVIQAIQNLGMASIALAAGAIVDSHGYLMVEVFFLMSLCLALAAAVLMYLHDAAKSGTLNMSASRRHRLMDGDKLPLEHQREIDNVAAINT